MMHLPAVVEVAAFAAEEDFMAAACAPPTLEAVPFMLDGSAADTEWPGEATGIVQYPGAR
ncbi:hypothetical protein AS156_29485 [Bradyrhizobium macuxiense]|uniref:Uncharacterized protein n=1 Tax=Bradyrhizobium macuxiense TaxID=1755647 RepID=A0A109K441_9BRAD|nr:hypothetical protein AS156_29485 [Bradyrhizobium macuxiense]